MNAGHVPPLPRFAPSVVTRAIKTECPKYHDIVQAYGKPNATPNSITGKHKSAVEAVSFLWVEQIAL